MTYYQQARRLMRWRTYGLVAFLALGALVTTFGDDLARAFIRPCDSAPTCRDDVPEPVCSTLEALHAEGLLYCSAPLEGLAAMHEPVYWGSDGLSSVLFFQADDMTDIEVTRYVFGAGPTGQGVTPGEPGASPPEGFRPARPDPGPPANQAAPGAHYFYRRQGAPADSDAVVGLSIAGPASTPDSFGDRDVFRDIERIWSRLQGHPESAQGITTVRTTIAVLPERWQARLRRHVAAELADEKGAAGYRALRDAAPTEPTLYQVVSGLLGTTVWVAGVVTGTRPALEVAHPGGQPVEHRAAGLWTSITGDQVLLHGAFDPIEAGTPVEVRYWSDETVASRPPDYQWSVSAP